MTTPASGAIAAAASDSTIDPDDFLQILVSPELRPFTVDKALIVSRSSFIATAISKRPTKPIFKPVILAKENSDNFGHYLYVLENGTFDPQYLYSDNQFVVIYLLADKLGDMRSANICINSIIEDFQSDETVPEHATIKFIYKNTPPGSMLRKLCVDYYIHELGAPGMEEAFGVLPSRLWFEMVIKNKEWRDDNGSGQVDMVFRNRVIFRDRCDYHQHDETFPNCDGL